MRFLMAQAVAAPLLFLGAIGVTALHQPSGSASAYGGSEGTVYTAQIIGGGPGLPRLPGAAPVLPITHPAPVIGALHAAPAAARLTGFDLREAPTVTPQLINTVLAGYGSPMAGEGRQLYDLGVKYGIDPAYCLAFFIHESAAGTRGEAVLTHNLGNIRAVTGEPSLDGYRYYDTWLQGAEDWYRLISTLYVRDWGLTTVSSIIPVYAPSADQNDPAAYIQDVEQLVSSWRTRG